MPAQAPKTKPPSNSPSALSPPLTEACLFRLTKAKVNPLSLTKALKMLSFVYFGPPQLSACTMSSAVATAETHSYRLAYISSTMLKLKYGNCGQHIPFTDLQSGRCYITLQNHGYAIDSALLPKKNGIESVKFSAKIHLSRLALTCHFFDSQSVNSFHQP
ncbi:carbamoyl-phosphate synthase small subunit [Puccinia sorghi]|uniref:Carbamoyl-phosphate synthase small subunit n=1 Tax=Puccinia sorghi TaxID=27349 RepID=A0A0L6VPL5_9BASI|nr:carbamoyl-phosphate synthase small subunit [Puccinia sorghi]